MKTIKKSMWMMSLMLTALIGFTSCEPDEDFVVANSISGHWFGDMDMWIGNEKAHGTDIEFIPSTYSRYRGEGTEVDWYRNGTVTHYFDWEVNNGYVYLTFDDPNLDCVIADYRLSYNYFTGKILDYNFEYQTTFRLRNYEHYWSEYGYGGYYDSSVKAEKDWHETTDSVSTSTENKVCYRGVNRAKLGL